MPKPKKPEMLMQGREVVRLNESNMQLIDRAKLVIKLKEWSAPQSPLRVAIEKLEEEIRSYVDHDGP